MLNLAQMTLVKYRLPTSGEFEKLVFGGQSRIAFFHVLCYVKKYKRLSVDRDKTLVWVTVTWVLEE